MIPSAPNPVPNPVNPVNPVKTTPPEPRIATTHELMMPFAADLVRMKAKGNSHGQIASWLHAQGVYANLAEIASFWPYHALQKQKAVPTTPSTSSPPGLSAIASAATADADHRLALTQSAPPPNPVPDPVNPVSRQSFSDGGCQPPCRAIMSAGASAKGEAQRATAEASAKGEAQGATADQKTQFSLNPQLSTNKTMASEAQIAANRLNAQKSTGPRTDAGKEASSRNSLKHTALARAVLVSSQSLQESSTEFSALCDEYHLALDPVGPLEEMLVDRIVTAVWRLRRARPVESAEIALNLETSAKKNDPPIDYVPTVLQAAEMLNQADVLQILEKSIPGCEYVLAHLRDARAAFSRDHRLTEDNYKTLNSAFRGRGLKVTAPLIEMALAFETNPAKIDPSTLQQLHHTEMLDFLDRQIQHYEESLAANTKRLAPDATTRARQDAALLPSGKTLDKILRYETALERQIFRALNQLEKLQSRRRANEQFSGSDSCQSGSIPLVAPTCPP